VIARLLQWSWGFWQGARRHDGANDKHQCYMTPIVSPTLSLSIAPGGLTKGC